MTYTWAEATANTSIRMVESLYLNLSEQQGATDPSLRQIVLWEMDAAYVMGSYADSSRLWATKPDLDGNCLLRIPSEIAGTIYTEAEAECIERCHDADMQLLSYAR